MKCILTLRYVVVNFVLVFISFLRVLLDQFAAWNAAADNFQVGNVNTQLSCFGLSKFILIFRELTSCLLHLYFSCLGVPKKSSLVHY